MQPLEDAVGRWALDACRVPLDFLKLEELGMVIEPTGGNSTLGSDSPDSRSLK
jgi:hypothetical protein